MMRLVESPTSVRWVVIFPSCLVKYNDGFRALEYSAGPFQLIVSNQRLWLPGTVIGANQTVISQAIISNASFPMGSQYCPFQKKRRKRKEQKTTAPFNQGVNQISIYLQCLQCLFNSFILSHLSSSPFFSPPLLSSLMMYCPCQIWNQWDGGCFNLAER